MISPKTGARVANQFIITTEEGQYFQSYQTIIAFMPKGFPTLQAVLDKTMWNYSRTTLKYLKLFLNPSLPATTAEIEKRIKYNYYKTDSLN